MTKLRQFCQKRNSQNYVISTGCFIWNFAISNGCSTETVHILPYCDEAKMCLRGGSLFENCKQTAEKYKQFFEN